MTNSRNFTLPSPTAQHCVSPVSLLLIQQQNIHAASCNKCDKLSQLHSSLNYHSTLCFPPCLYFWSNNMCNLFATTLAHCTWAHVSLLTPGMYLSCPDNPAPGDSDRLCQQHQFRPGIKNKDESQACLFTLFPGLLRLRINATKMPMTP